MNLLSALLLATLLGLHAAGASDPARQPNVIVVMTDDQGYGDLSVTGNPILKTPNMDRLAREGVQFTNRSSYDGGHRVPCFLSWPVGGFKMPATVDRLAAHLDLLPTLVDLCALRLPKPVKFDGTSLKPLLANPQAEWPERTLVIGSGDNKTGPNAPPPEFGKNCAVMTECWRLVNDLELFEMIKQSVAPIMFQLERNK